MTPREKQVTACFAPRKMPGVVEWLSQNISLPRKMAPKASGRFTTSRRRYQNTILECWHPESGTNHVDVAGATQGFKTTGCVLGICYRMKHKPWPVHIMGPAAKWSETEIGKLRMQPIIRENRVLAELMPDDMDNFTNQLMDMKCGPIKIVGANSPTQIGGMSAGIVCIDEATKIKKVMHEEAPDAHPIYNAWERSKDFRDVAYFHYMSSSPTSPNHPFWLSIEEGTQERFHCECPHCKEWFPFALPGYEDMSSYFELIGKAPPADYKSLIWDQSAKDVSGEWNQDKVRASARYVCPHNGCEINEQVRQGVVASAEITFP